MLKKNTPMLSHTIEHHTLQRLPNEVVYLKFQLNRSLWLPLFFGFILFIFNTAIVKACKILKMLKANIKSDYIRQCLTPNPYQKRRSYAYTEAEIQVTKNGRIMFQINHIKIPKSKTNI